MAILYVPMELLIQKEINISYIHMWIVDIAMWLHTVAIAGNFRKVKFLKTSQSI